MDTKDLKSFVALCKTLNYSQAADLTAQSPSTLTRSIQRLERELDCSLFCRNTKRVSLTPAGIRLENFANTFLDELKLLKHEVKSVSSSIKGQLRVYCSVTASYYILPKILSGFQERYPHIELRIETGDAALAVSKVMSNKTDIAIAARPDISFSKVLFKSVSSIPLVFIAPINMRINSDDLSNIPIILPEQGLLRRRIEDWFSVQKAKMNVYAEVAGNEAIVSMVSLGCGIGIVPEAVIDKSPVGNNVQIIPFKPDLTPFDVSLCMSKIRYDEPVLKAFWNTAEELLT